MVKNYLFSVIRIVAILITFFNSAFAQSKHAALWNFHDDVYLDFSSGQAVEKENSPELRNAVWYVDADGEIALTVKEGIVYNKNMQQVENCGSFTETLKLSNCIFFIPVPTNENFVYLFSGNKYILIDINANQAVSEIEELDVVSTFHIAVHTSDCKGVWLIYYDRDNFCKYLITENGVSKQTEDISALKSFPGVIINLSKDCKHYSKLVIATGHYTISYGDYNNGDFIERNNFEFPIIKENKFYSENIIQAVISEDNSKIYYTSISYMLNSQYRRIVGDEYWEIYKADIVSGVPDYENVVKIYSDKEYKAGVVLVRPISYYGNDGGIYFFQKHRKCYFVIYSNTDDGIKVEKRPFYPNIREYRTPWFVSSWFSENPCNGNDVPCSGTSIPKIICE